MNGFTVLEEELMKKRVLSLFMALALCLSMTPMSYAEEAGAVTEQEAQSGESITDDTTDGDTTGNDVSGGDVSDGDADVQDAKEDAAVRAVQALIDALPGEVTAENADELQAQLTAIDEALAALTEERRVGLDMARYENIRAALTGFVAVQEGGHSHPICGDVSCTDSNHKLPDGAEWQGVDTLTNNMTAGYYYLTDNVELPETWELSTNIVLCLNGHSITQTTTLRAVRILKGGMLTLTDCKGGGTLTHAANVNGTGVYVAGTFTMYGGSVTGHTNPDSDGGGGVYVVKEGIFTMYGGSITGNTNTGSNGGAGVFVKSGGKFTLNGGSISGNTSTFNYSAGGVYVRGTFTMGGGDITGNKNTYDGYSAGGVFVGGGTFTMSNGKITKNTSAYYGGGVYIDSGTFTMDGGSISVNESTEKGGGVQISLGTFTMSNGEITGNKSTNGGGVYKNFSGELTIEGGIISGNNAKETGGGVYANAYSDGSIFTVSGAAQITGNWTNGTFDTNAEGYVQGTGEANNAYLAGSGSIGSTIILGAGLSEDARIGVSISKWSLPTAGNNVKIATGATNNELNYAEIFSLDMDDQSYSVIRDSEDLYICLHQHRWGYEVSEDGATINAICKEGCNTNGGSVTIKAPDAGTLTYDGNPKTATLENKLPAGVTAPTITYKVKGSDSPIEAPVNAGTYIASITLTGVDNKSATASVEYTIKADQANLVITGDNTVVYGKTLTLGTTGGSGTGDVTFRIDKNSSTGEATIAGNILTAGKTGDVFVIATKAGDADYNEVVSESFIITITQATPTGKPAYTEITTDGKTLADAGLTLTGSTLSPAAGTLEWIDAEGKVLSGNTRVEANKTYTWRFTPEDKNYGTLTGDVLLYLVEAPPAPKYRIIDGADSSWTQNVDGSLVIRGDGEFADFLKVLVDGSEIDPANYTATKGSTIITLKPEFLSTLSEGSHTFAIVWRDGSADTHFTVARNSSGNSGGNNNGSNNSSDNAGSSDGTADKTVIAPKTGDDSMDALPAVFVVVSFAGLAGVLVFKKKNTYK